MLKAESQHRQGLRKTDNLRSLILMLTEKKNAELPIILVCESLAGARKPGGNPGTHRNYRPNPHRVAQSLGIKPTTFPDTAWRSELSSITQNKTKHCNFSNISSAITPQFLEVQTLGAIRQSFMIGKLVV